MDIKIASYELTGLGRINLLMGKNGCGKSVLLRALREYKDESVGIINYITPERGGSFNNDSGIVSAMETDPNWLEGTRNRNQLTSFRQQSEARLRRLRGLTQEALEDMFRDKALIDPSKHQDKLFDNHLSRINALLENIEIVKNGRNSGFIFCKKGDASQVPILPTNLSSGESELITLATECLVFSKEADIKKTNILLIDEPDVHLHPDLQAKLINFLVDLITDKPYMAVIIATHSSAIVGSLEGKDGVNIAFIKSGNTKISFNPISECIKKIIPIFGAHPLSNVFNASPILIVEGEDDERIWQQAVRSSENRIKLWPRSVFDGVADVDNFEDEVKIIIESVYDNAKGYSLRDRDGTTGVIGDKLPIICMKLDCYSAENLFLTNEVLKSLGTDWDSLKDKIDAWLINEENKSDKYFRDVQSFKDDGYQRKDFNIKKIRGLLMVKIIGEYDLWENKVGKAIGKLKWSQDSLKEEGSLWNFLGEKVCQNLLSGNKSTD
jgi:ABC-type multidrug transport system ATPase subunit